MSWPNENLQGQLEKGIRLGSVLADLFDRFVGVPTWPLQPEIVEAERPIREPRGAAGLPRAQPGKKWVPQFAHDWAGPGPPPAEQTSATAFSPSNLSDSGRAECPFQLVQRNRLESNRTNQAGPGE
jgi:hypothetical protein